MDGSVVARALGLLSTRKVDGFGVLAGTMFQAILILLVYESLASPVRDLRKAGLAHRRESSLQSRPIDACKCIHVESAT